MPHGEPDATDPMMLQGVSVEAGDDAHREMASCFVEEYLRLGFDTGRLLKMFQTPQYLGPHLAWRVLGEDAVRSIIDEHAARRGGFAPCSVAERRSDGGVGLRVLDDDGA